MLPTISVVVVHRNAVETLRPTVEQFLALEHVEMVHLVDNGSDRGAVDSVREAARGWGERVDLVEPGANTGFGPGANLGLRRWLEVDSSNWAVLVPHDVELAPDCLPRMFDAAADDPMVGLMCADVGDGQLPVMDAYFGGMTRPAPPGCGWEDAGYPHGTLMAVARSCATDVGLFDERYFAYCEEADLAVRARAAGWRVGLVRGARVTNCHLSSSVALVDYLQQRNTLLLVRDASGRYHTFIRFLIALAQLGRGVARPERRPLVFDARARVLALRDFLRGRFGAPPPDLVG